MPSELFSFKNQEIVIDQDNPYAKYTIENNKVKFEITDITKAPGVEAFEGSLEIIMQVDNVEKLIQKDYIIENPFNQEDVIELKIEHEFEATLTKQAESKIDQKTLRKNQILWSVEVNKDQADLGDATLKDILSDTATFLKDTIKIYEVNYYADGTLIKEGDFAPKDVTKEFTEQMELDDNSINIEFTPLNKAYVVEVVTEVKEDKIPIAGGDVTVSNEVTLNSANDKPKSITVDKVIHFESIAKKTVTKSADFSQDRTLTWTVTYNPDYRTIDDPKFEDVFNNEMMTLDKNNIKVTLTASEGSKKELNGNEILEIKNDGFIFPKEDAVLDQPFNQHVTIEYNTKIKEGIVIDENINKFWNRIDIEEKKGGNVVPELANEIGIKHAHGIDYANQKVKWQIIVNPEYLNIKEVKITDDIRGYTGHFFTEEDLNRESFKIKRVTKDSHPNHVGEEVKFEIMGGSEQFELKISETYDNEVNYKYVIEYQSSFDKAKLNLSEEIKNKANISFIFNNKSISKDVSATNKLNQIYTDNGAKYGEYNAETKIFTWYLFINTKQLNETTVVIDTLNQDGHKFITSESVQIAQFDPSKVIGKDKQNNIKYAKGLEYKEAREDQVKNLTFEDKKVAFTLQHEKIDTNKTEAYVVKLESTLEGALVNAEKFKYTNEASLIDNNDKKTKISDTVIIPQSHNGNLNKQGKISEGNVADWEIRVNYVQSTLTDVVVMDKLDNYQAFIDGSFKLFPVEVKGNQYIISKKELKKDRDYTLTIDEEKEGDVATIKLHPEGETTIATPYLIKYQTIFSTPEDRTLRNKVTIDASNNESKTDFITETSQTVEQQSTGTAGARNQSLTIFKESDNKKAIAGVQFSLWTHDGKYKLKEGITDDEGKLTFDRLFSGTFILKEVHSPGLGYVPLKNQTIKLPQKTGTPTSELHITNHARQIELNKILDGQTELSKDLLEAAQFKLEIESDGKWEEVKGISIELNNDKKFIFSKEHDKLQERGFKPGKYRITEVKAPTGYILNTIPVEFEVSTNNVKTEVSLTNYQGTFEFKKINELSEALRDVAFTLYTNDGKEVKTAQSDVDGKVVFDKLAPGKYIVKESELSDVYTLNTNPIEFEISAESKGEPKVIKGDDFVNYKGRFEMVKTDEFDQVLAGATFKLYTHDGEEVQTTTSTETGLVVFEGLAPGSYYVKETAAPEGYVINTKTVSFYIADKVTKKPVIKVKDNFKNYQGRYEFTKQYDNETPTLPSIFALYNAEGEVVMESQTDTDNKVVFAQLAPGTYTVKEISTDPSYVLNTTEHTFTISDDHYEKEVLVGKDFTNYQGTFEFKKINELGEALSDVAFTLYTNDGKEVKTAQSDVDGKVVFDKLAPGKYIVKESELSDVYTLNTNPIEFEISAESKGEPKVIKGDDFVNYKGRFEMVKTDEFDQVLAGATFKLYTHDGEEVQTTTSTETGLVVFEGLAPGSYYVKETAAPEGYVINTKTVSFYIADKVTKKPVIKVKDNFKNYQGRYEFTKQYDNETPTLPSIFALYNAEGEVVMESQTDTDNKVVFAQLAPGTYTVKEISTDPSYVLNTTEHTFTISDAHYEKEVLVGKDFTNYQGAIKLYKVNEYDQALADATFILRNGSGEILAELTTNENGEVTFNGLKPGDYTVSEIEAPKGYVRDTKSYTFTIADEFEEQQIIEHTLINYQGLFQLIKTDEKGNVLSGAEFTLYDHEDNVVAVTISDKQGHVRFEGLAPGSYYVKETKAPIGYVRNTKVLSFFISQQSPHKPEVKFDSFKNYQGSVTINKVNEDKEIIKDDYALFNLLDANKKVIAKNIKTKQGIAYFDGLAPGIYYLEEVKAPKHFIKTDKLIKFEIVEESYEGVDSTIIEVTNEFEALVLGTSKKPKPIAKLPSTGISNTPMYVALGAIIIGIILKIKRNKSWAMWTG